MTVFRYLLQLVCLFAVLADSASAADRVIVQGDQEYQPLRLKRLADGSQLDLDDARFRVAVSGNKHPTERRNCKTGGAPLNRYPLAVENSRDVTIQGGLFAGEVPQGSDWLHTYCNSAALRLEKSPRVSVRELRMRRVWDGIRFDEGTSDFRVDRVWMSEVRDDCLENDNLMAGRIRDSLLDGCFAGISVAPIDGTKKQPTVRLEHVLLRMRQYPYRGKLGHALPIKVQEYGGARFQIYDSIFAVDAVNVIGGQHIRLMWDSISKCGNNKLLWLGPGDLPAIYAGAPSCFKRLSGSEAHEAWEHARRRWIEENPGVARFNEDEFR